MDLRALIAGLAAAFPREAVGPETLAVYERMLADLPLEELAPVVARHLRTGRRFPSIAELAGEVFELRLALPEPDEAWQRAQRLAFARPEYVDCAACGGRGLSDVAAERRCPECGGSGQREIARHALRAELTAAEREALEAVGGARGIAEAEILAVARSQFLKAYEACRRRALERANVRSALDQPGALGELGAGEAA